METKELNHGAPVNIKFVKDTKFNKAGDIAAIKSGVARKLLAAGIAKEFSAPVKKEVKTSKPDKKEEK